MKKGIIKWIIIGLITFPLLYYNIFILPWEIQNTYETMITVISLVIYFLMLWIIHVDGDLK